jgi:hypothetical protein
MTAQLASKATEAKLNALIHRLTTGIATIGDIEAARALLKANGFTTVSSGLFRLADVVRERLDDDPELAREVHALVRKDRR